MAYGYIPNRELFGQLKRVSLQHQASFQPRPKRGRRVRSGSGGSEEKPRAIRGLYQSGTATLQISNIVVLDSGTDPRVDQTDEDEIVEVANIPGDSYTALEAVYADWSEVHEQWEARPKASDAASEPPLRRFELTANKATTDATATAKFLDDAGNMIGSDQTLYDPMGKFYGKNAAFYGGGTGFRGVALLRRDPAAIESDRWEIVMMEGWAEWVVMQYVGSPDNEWQMQAFGGDQWNFRQPVEVGDPVTIADPLDLLGEAEGDMFIGVMVNPDTSPPTYQEREIKRAGFTSVTIKSFKDIQIEGLTVKIISDQYAVLAKLLDEDVEDTADIPLVCTTTEVVTEVACVEGEVVGETTNITYVSAPCPE